MNKAFCIGRFSADPELRQTGSGISVCSFTLAVDRPYQKDKESVPDWLDCVAWRNTAEFIAKHFSKGDPIIVEGSIQTRMWEDKAGQKRKAVEIIADNVEFVPRTRTADNLVAFEHDPAPVEHGSFSAGSDEDFAVVEDEDLPF